MVETQCPDNTELLSIIAVGTKDLFQQLFQLFSACHKLYDSREYVDGVLLGEFKIIFVALSTAIA